MAKYRITATIEVEEDHEGVIDPTLIDPMELLSNMLDPVGDFDAGVISAEWER